MAQAGNADDGDRVAVSKDALDGIERLIRVTQSMTETMSKINGSMERYEMPCYRPNADGFRSHSDSVVVPQVVILTKGRSPSWPHPAVLAMKGVRLGRWPS